MRNVLRSIDEVCHYWANQIQPSGRAASVFFSGETIYSYGQHFPMATIYPGNGVAFTSRSYSVTTSSHMSRARRAANHMTVIHVINPEDAAISQVHTTRLQVAELLEKAKRARQNKPYLLAEAATKVRDFNTFAQWRGEDIRITDDLGALDEEIKLAIADRDRAKEEARRQYEEENREALEDWLQGRSNWCPHTSTPRLRIANALAAGDDPFDVQTSWGARIPSREAMRLYPVILRVMNGERDYEVGMSLGDYRLTKIRRDGSIVVGCHDIPWSEISRMAEVLRLFEGAEA